MAINDLWLIGSGAAGVLVTVILTLLFLRPFRPRTTPADKPPSRERREFRAFVVMVIAVFVALFGTLGAFVATLFMEAGQLDKAGTILGTGGPLTTCAYILFHAWNNTRKDNHEREMKELEQQIRAQQPAPPASPPVPGSSLPSSPPSPAASAVP